MKTVLVSRIVYLSRFIRIYLVVFLFISKGCFTGIDVGVNLAKPSRIMSIVERFTFNLDLVCIASWRVPFSFDLDWVVKTIQISIDVEVVKIDNWLLVVVIKYHFALARWYKDRLRHLSRMLWLQLLENLFNLRLHWLLQSYLTGRLWVSRALTLLHYFEIFIRIRRKDNHFINVSHYFIWWTWLRVFDLKVTLGHVLPKFGSILNQ